MSSIKRIRKESNEAGESSLSTPGKERHRDKFEVDDFDRRVIRETISDFYLVQKKVPSVPKLLLAIRERIDFPLQQTTLRSLLHEMGFQWKRCQSRRKILIEKPNIVAWRAKYLRAIKKYRGDNKEIVYIDESWVDNNLTFKKCWQSKEIEGKY